MQRTGQRQKCQLRSCEHTHSLHHKVARALLRLFIAGGTYDSSSLTTTPLLRCGSEGCLARCNAVVHHRSGRLHDGDNNINTKRSELLLRTFEWDRSG